MTTSRPSSLSLIWQQTRYQNKIFWRTPISAFFTIIFPLLILVVFAAIFGSEEIEHLGVTVAQYYAPALAVFSAAAAVGFFVAVFFAEVFFFETAMVVLI